MPDHVFFGLILGTIRGPLKNLPEKKANVSLVNERLIIKKNKYLSWTKILKLKYKIKNTEKEKKRFLYFLLIIKKKRETKNIKNTSLINKKS